VFDQPSDMEWAVQVMNFLTTLFAESYSYVIPLRLHGLSEYTQGCW